MFEELHWLPLRARIQFKILTLMFKAQRGLAPKYLIEVLYFGLILLPPTVYFVPPIDSTSWFPTLEPLWLNVDPLPQLVPLFGLRFLLLFVLQFYLAVSLLLSLLLKLVFSHGALHSGSASERFTLLEAL